MSGYYASAGSADWCTPKKILNAVRRFFGGRIHLDPCWNRWSSVDPVIGYSLPEHDGLVDTWEFPNAFVNPPYGASYVHRETREWSSAEDLNRRLKALPADKRAEEKAKWRRGTVLDWVLRCAWAFREFGTEVVALIPSSVDTATWQDGVAKTATAVCDIRARVSFELPPQECWRREYGSGTGASPQCAQQAAVKGTKRGAEGARKTVYSCDACKELVHGVKKWRKLSAAEPAPMACSLVYWGAHPDLFEATFASMGTIRYPRANRTEVEEKWRITAVATLQALLEVMETRQDLREDPVLPVAKALIAGRGEAALEYLEALEGYAEAGRDLDGVEDPVEAKREARWKLDNARRQVRKEVLK